MRNAGTQYRSIFSVCSPQPALCAKRPPGIESRRICLITVFQVFRMHILSPTAAQFLLQSPAGKIQPGLVEKREHLVRACDPDHYRSRVGHVSEALFALAERDFIPPALGYVPHDLL